MVLGTRRCLYPSQLAETTAACALWVYLLGSWDLRSRGGSAGFGEVQLARHKTAKAQPLQGLSQVMAG